jgi:hypothetical protein
MEAQMEMNIDDGKRRPEFRLVCNRQRRLRLESCEPGVLAEDNRGYVAPALHAEEVSAWMGRAESVRAIRQPQRAHGDQQNCQVAPFTAPL